MVIRKMKDKELGADEKSQSYNDIFCTLYNIYILYYSDVRCVNCSGFLEGWTAGQTQSRGMSDDGSNNLSRIRDFILDKRHFT